LHGRRPRPFWFAAQQDVTIPLDDIINVVRAGVVVQCHVRLPGSSNTPLQVWAADEAAAQRLVELLPKGRTEQFERLLAEQGTFDQELQALGTRPIVTPVLVAANCFVFACTVVAGAGLLQPDGVLLTLGDQLRPAHAGR
jgi:hypothetical protein